MMRVKNEARWIGRVLGALREAVDDLFVFDDGSTDDTRAIAAWSGAIVMQTPFNDLNEGRDKNFLMGRVQELACPDWIVQVDGDEILLDPADLRITIETTTADAIRLRVLYAWNREDLIRVDGSYGRFRRGSAFRPARGARFTDGFHCSNVPTAGWNPRTLDVERSPLLHLGYLHREDRIRKYIWYNAKDPNNRAEDCYRHMVAGDPLPPECKLPATSALSRTKHGGPLTIKPLRELVP